MLRLLCKGHASLRHVAPLATRSLASLASPQLHAPLQPPVRNEPLPDYEPGSAMRARLRESLTRLGSETHEVPCVVGGRDVHTGDVGTQVMPSAHSRVLARFHNCNKELLEEAVEDALRVKESWAATPFADRAAVFLKAADLLSTKYRTDLIAATMLGQGKNVWQGEIDAGAETIDFLRLNPKFAEDMYAEQPPLHSQGVWNRVEYRPLEGFVLAISPFNFTAIGANLPSSPALMGNVCVWKPSSTAILANYITLQALREAGLPDGVIQFLPGSGPTVGEFCLNSHEMSGLHFTGSTKTFNYLWRKVAANLENYRTYPRIVGETGGKNFHFLHESCDVDTAVNQTVRGAFEYSGQKCSATSRMYVPDTLWPTVKDKLVAATDALKVGHVEDFSVFTSAVIDQSSFTNIARYIDGAKESDECTILAGGEYDDSEGYFVRPTIIETSNPQYTTMKEEIFGPVLSVYVYDAAKLDDALALCDQTSPYGLTGSIFARDRAAIVHMSNALRNAAGNFYINDKSTGAVVGQQPFGGARGSGTNDKAGAKANLYRWVSQRSVKETFVPLGEIGYPHMAEE